MLLFLKSKKIVFAMSLLFIIFSLFLYYLLNKDNFKNDQINDFSTEKTKNEFLQEYFARGNFVKYKNKNLTLNVENLGNKEITQEIVFQIDEKISKIECWPTHTTTSNGTKVYYRDVFLDANNNMKNPLATNLSFIDFEKKIDSFLKNKYFFIITQNSISLSKKNIIKTLIFLGCE